MRTNVVVRVRELTDELPHRMFSLVPRAINEPGLAPRSGLDEGGEHADEWRHADAPAEQDHGALTTRVEQEPPPGRLCENRRADLDLVVKEGRRNARIRIRALTWRRLSLDRESVVVGRGTVRE